MSNSHDMRGLHEIGKSILWHTGQVEFLSDKQGQCTEEFLDEQEKHARQNEKEFMIPNLRPLQK